MKTKRKKTYLKWTILFFLVLLCLPQTINAEELSFTDMQTSVISIPDEQFLESQEILFKPEVTGYVTITVTLNSPKLEAGEALYSPTGTIDLLNEKKKRLSAGDYAIASENGSDTVTFAVRKGKVYYFDVETDCGVNLTADIVSVKETAGEKKEKAKSIKRNQITEGLIIAGEKKTDWYKIKLNRNRQIKLTYTTKSHDNADVAGIKVTFCKSNGKKLSAEAVDWITKAAPENWMKLGRKKNGKKTGLAAGIYYIKVESYAPKGTLYDGCGYYTLKWN